MPRGYMKYENVLINFACPTEQDLLANLEDVLNKTNHFSEIVCSAVSQKCEDRMRDLLSEYENRKR